MYAIKLNREVYDDAAKFAKSQNVSVEQFVETLIIKAVNEKPKFKYKSEDELSPLVKSLIGIIPQADGADEHDYKKARMDYLTEKYNL